MLLHSCMWDFFGHRNTQWGCVPMINGWGAWKHLRQVSHESGHAKQTEKELWCKRTILPQRQSAYSSVWFSYMYLTQWKPCWAQVLHWQHSKNPCETIPRCPPNTISVCNSYRVNSPLLSVIPTLQPAAPDSLSMMTQVQDKSSDFSQLLAHCLQTRC